MKRFALVVALLIATPALAEGQSRIVVPARDIMRGETIADSDLAYQDVSPDRAASVVMSMNDLSGMQARRFLRAGEAVRSDDVRRPILVTKGSMVTMVFSAPGITLTATGKAMTEGGMGEPVTVLNPISYRQITATVTGAGTVNAGSTMQTISQIAAN
jgi:flagellar basal body P-ring formation protein FlgA